MLQYAKLMFFVVLLFVGELLSFRKISFYRTPICKQKNTPALRGRSVFFLLLFYMNILYI